MSVPKKSFVIWFPSEGIVSGVTCVVR
jgi:hypothetical protein